MHAMNSSVSGNHSVNDYFSSFYFSRIVLTCVMLSDLFHHPAGQAFLGKTRAKCTLTLSIQDQFSSQLSFKGFPSKELIQSLKIQVSCLGKLQVTERAMVDPLPYVIICTYKVHMSYENLGEKFCSGENSHIYGSVCLCVLVKGKLIYILLSSVMEN